jgi:hypothetical protein
MIVARVTGPAGAGERFECRVIGVRQGVQIAFGGPQSGVAEAFPHGLQVRSPSQHPRCMCVPQIPDPDPPIDAGRPDRGIPDLLTEPILRDVPIGIQSAPGPRIVLACRAPSLTSSPHRDPPPITTSASRRHCSSGNAAAMDSNSAGRCRTVL